MTAVSVTLTLACFTLFALMALVLHKVRRIHIATYTLLSDVRRTRRETEHLFAQLQALLALERTLALPGPLPALRGWAGSPDFLWRLTEEVRALRPEVVLECSSGASTLVTARCLQMLGHGHVFSLEHDPHFARLSREALARQGLSDWATVIDAPLIAQEGGGRWYGLGNLPDAARNARLLVVDGPPADSGPQARSPALSMLRDRLSPGCVILLDDADRADERKAVEEWQRNEPALIVQYLPMEKGLARLQLPGR